MINIYLVLFMYAFTLSVNISKILYRVWYYFGYILVVFSSISSNQQYFGYISLYLNDKNSESICYQKPDITLQQNAVI